MKRLGLLLLSLNLLVGSGCGSDKEDPGDHRELCGIYVGDGCHDGVVHGEFGYSCSPITVHCENGCSSNPRSVASYSGNDGQIAAQYIEAALCEPSRGGDGGAGAGGESGD